MENVVADHFSRIEGSPCTSLGLLDFDDEFPSERLYVVTVTSNIPWFADYGNYLVGWFIPKGLKFHEKKKFFKELRYLFWDEPYLFKICADQVIRWCVADEEHDDILAHCHSMQLGGHFGANRTIMKVLECGFYWPTLHKDAQAFVAQCDRCQRTGNISSRHEFPLNNMIVCEIFDVWGIDFMGPFPSSLGKNIYWFALITFLSGLRTLLLPLMMLEWWYGF